MGSLSQSSSTKLQRKYLVPAVDDLWEEKQGEITAEMTDKDLVLLRTYLNFCCDNVCGSMHCYKIYVIFSASKPNQ